jgi:hypothetical protein
MLRRDHPREVRLTLLAVLCWCQLPEITNSLVELFVKLMHRINARAERRVDKEIIAEFRRVQNAKEARYLSLDPPRRCCIAKVGL